MQTDKEILEQFGEKLVADFKAVIPRVSGKTADSVHMVSDDNEMTVFGAWSLGALEYGRKPTGIGKGGNGSLLKNIKEWLAMKGLALSPFAVVANIHRYGTTLYRIKQGTFTSASGRSLVNYQANPIGLNQLVNEQRMSSLKEVFASKYMSLIKSEIIKDLK